MTNSAMITVTDPANHQVWTAQVLRILDDEFQADQKIAPPSGQCLNVGFEPVAHWFVDALAPLISTNATLRGESLALSLGADQIMGPDAKLTILEQFITAQLRYNFGFDTYFDAMHHSALEFAADNTAMIQEHFGNADNYAEYYAESSCEMMQQIAARGPNRVLVKQMIEAFRTADVAAWSACFPGSFVRGVLTSHALAQGSTAPAALADTLKHKLCAAFAAYDRTTKTGE